MKITVGIKEIKPAVALARTQIYPVAYKKEEERTEHTNSPSKSPTM